MKACFLILGLILAVLPLANAQDSEQALDSLNRAQNAAQEELSIPVKQKKPDPSRPDEYIKWAEKKEKKKKKGAAKATMKSSMSQSVGFTV